MSVLVAKLNKQNLQGISVDERVLFFSLAHLANEINALQKLLLWSAHFDSGNNVVIEGQLSLTLMLLKILAGKLYEGNDLLRSKFYGAKVSQDYVQHLTQEGIECLNEIKNYFDQNHNTVRFIRNDFAFHYSPEKADASLQLVPDEELKVYVEKQASANNLYYFAEVLANRALFHTMNKQDHQVAFRQLFTEIGEVSHWFSVACDVLLTEFLKRHSSNVWVETASEVSFDQLPAFGSVKIPWFTNTSDIVELYEKLFT